MKNNFNLDREEKNFGKWVWGVGIGVVALLVISVGVMIFGKMGFFEGGRIVLGSVYVLFLPGFILSYVFFPTGKKEVIAGKEKERGIDVIERVALSFALSIAVVPLVVFYLNLIGLKINVLNSFITILGIIVIGIGLVFWVKNRAN